MKQPLLAISFSILLLVSWLVATQPVLAAKGDIFGNISMPEPLRAGYGTFDAASNPGGGIIGFASNLIKLIMILGGIWALINIVLAGFAYITTQGNPEKIAQANQQIFMSLIGLAVMVASFALAALAGWLLFGDASAILSPQIYGPGISGTPAG